MIVEHHHSAKTVNMGIMPCFILLILWGFSFTFGAESPEPITNVLNTSLTVEGYSEEESLEENNEILGNPPQDTLGWESNDPPEENWVWGISNASTTQKTLEIDDKWYEPRDTLFLPENFDAREHWPECRSLRAIYDQGACQGGWVFASVAAITDRFCIAWNGTRLFHASPEDALTCSGAGSCRGGGDSKKVYLYWQHRGIVSGGWFNSRYGCKPYRIPPCPIHFRGLPCHPRSYVPPQRCMPYCIRGYPSSYEKDRKFASEVYQLRMESDIKADLYYNGPVTAFMNVFEDFFRYRGGVYKQSSGKFWYGHYVKLIGWGEENGVKYWLGANSWNIEWGERGFFKILRGENHCDIESFVIGGIPKL